MKNVYLLLLITLFSMNLIASNEPIAGKKFFISQVIDHPALNSTVKGIIDKLEENGFKSNENLIKTESAQGNMAMASQIAVKFVNQNPDIVVGVGTLSAQSFAKYALEKKLKLIFSSVTDPIGAKLVKNLDKPANNISGVSNFVELEPQINLFLQLQPNLKRLGILYNPAESNSVSIVERLTGVCSKLKISLVKQTISNTAEVSQAATKLANQVDAIFISNDNTALSAIQTIIQIANTVKVPVYVSDTDAVNLGALAALGPNQYQIGLQTGEMILRCLRGEDITNMAVEFPNKNELYINLEAAKILGITIPDDIKAQSKIIEKTSK